ncbi:MAG TPA: hypothetical protein VGN81_08225 [Pseudonocardiaceae bacterium]|jgi:hypothetical protein
MSALPGPRPTKAEADARLDRLRTDTQRVDTAMTDLENDPGYRFLSGSRLTGTTLTRWTSARQALDQLWTDVGDLHSVLDQAEAIRARHSQPKPDDLDELDALLTGPAVRHASANIPLAQRGLTGPATVVTSVSVVQLIATMTTSYADVVRLCSEAQAVLSAHASTLDESTTRLVELTGTLASLGLADSGHPLVARLAGLDTALDEVRELVFTDPLALTDPRTGQPNTDRLDAATAELASARHDLDALVAFHANGDAELSRLAGELAGLVDAENQAGAAMGAVRAAIATTGLPDAPDAAPGLTERLAALRASRSGPDWWRGVDRGAALSDAIGTACAAARQVSELATALLDREAELRGRLDAYQAKAGALGLAEDASLTASYELARSLLWTAPCDLAAATRALAAYQRLITERESTR